MAVYYAEMSAFVYGTVESALLVLERFLGKEVEKS